MNIRVHILTCGITCLVKNLAAYPPANRIPYYEPHDWLLEDLFYCPRISWQKTAFSPTLIVHQYKIPVQTLKNSSGTWSAHIYPLFGLL